MLTLDKINPPEMLRPRRKITGASAVLLPLSQDGEVEWDDFRSLVRNTFASDLIPAVNMDTGYGNLIDDETRIAVLKETQTIGDGRDFIAGAFVGDAPGDSLNADGYRRAIEQIQVCGGTPILFQSYGLAHAADDEIVSNYATVTQDCDAFYAFELGTMFAPFGNIYSLEVYEQLLRMESCRGAKHSSLSRELEWQRILLRDSIRPDFRVMTGNDLAIDMVMYGSDYLLGLSTFAPEAFALRDRMWESGDTGFYELNDLLQYLGTYTFRRPVPAYKHDAAIFLNLRGRIKSDRTWPGSPERDSSDRDVLEQIADDLRTLMPNA